MAQVRTDKKLGDNMTLTHFQAMYLQSVTNLIGFDVVGSNLSSG